MLILFMYGGGSHLRCTELEEWLFMISVNIVNTVDILWHVAEHMRHILNASQGTFCGMLKTACFLGGGVI